MHAAAELFKALSSRARLALLLELERGPACVHELVHGSGASQSLVSQHLRVLRGAQLVRGDRRGKEVVYTLMDSHISHLVADAIAHVGEARPRGPAPAAGPDRHEHTTSVSPTSRGDRP